MINVIITIYGNKDGKKEFNNIFILSLALSKTLLELKNIKINVKVNIPINIRYFFIYHPSIKDMKIIYNLDIKKGLLPNHL